MGTVLFVTFLHADSKCIYMKDYKRDGPDVIQRNRPLRRYCSLL
jgi:hypothetical protein